MGGVRNGTYHSSSMYGSEVQRQDPQNDITHIPRQRT